MPFNFVIAARPLFDSIINFWLAISITKYKMHLNDAHLNTMSYRGQLHNDNIVMFFQKDVYIVCRYLTVLTQCPCLSLSVFRTGNISYITIIR